MSLVPAERETARSVEDIWARLERFAAEGAKPQPWGPTAARPLSLRTRVC